ncbi:acyltransferase family protein [Streptosporangium saharense]|uniref:Fucose 4-O-acetylase-like acetyltransferase n=1 Tax=Streptosporangium saharense TaxID=1706840 RepID=A0A7W7VLC6_9ACTN|nr:acyltransferase family protein [Streptosporangium saharense]MBB4914249.1 fucose 4-O-acetylase-like acetyltransferase [Streptosporangium saharense]
MSDTRPSSQVPAPRDDGAPGAGDGGQPGAQGERAAPWPQPPSWPVTSEGGGSEGAGSEGAGEVTAWGYPAYREPGNAPGNGASSGEAASGARQTRSPYPDPHETPAPAPDPRDRDARWAQEFGAAQARAWTSGTSSSETFSYWENSARQQPEPSHGSYGENPARQRPEPRENDRQPSAWGEATVSPWEHVPPVPPHAESWDQAPPGPPPATPYTEPVSAEVPERAAPRRRGSRAARMDARPRIPAYLNEHAPATEQQGVQVPVGAHAAPGLSTRDMTALEWEQRAYAEEPPAAPAKKKREPYLDNVKFILIALVVTGHSLVPTLAAHSSKSAYLFIYTFHMPAFVLISGYLGRNFWNSNAKINKLVDTMLVPYAFIEIGYALLRYSLGQKWTLTIIDPAWLNWYLVALVLWRISTPIWTRMRRPLLVAVTIYMVAGFSEISGDFSLDRFFGLLPFYVFGLLLKPEHFDLLKPLWVRIAAGFVIAGAVAVAIYIAPRVGLDPVYYRYSFKYMHISWWMGLIVRAAMLLAGLTLSIAVLALVPRRETWFSDLGTRTLYAYLLHGVIVLIAKDQKWLSVPWLYGPLGVLAIASSALVLAIILCLPQTRTLFKWLLEPRLVWLYRRPSSRESSAAIPR